MNLDHFTGSSNLRPLRDQDAPLGRALLRFARMIDDGTALKMPTDLPTLFNPHKDYPSGNHSMAKFSLWRALRQYEKGRLTVDELREITARCEATLAISSKAD